MAAVVAFETYASVSEVISEVLSFCQVNHVSCLVPVLEQRNARYFLDVLRRHEPRLVLSSWDRIGLQVIAAAQSVRPKPEVWLFTGYDDETLLREGALFVVDRVFEKPCDGLKVALEIQRFLGLAPPVPV
ncbi:MAG: hypothetical protein AAB844_00220 [Patescibacteria group bacterium]